MWHRPVYPLRRLGSLTPLVWIAPDYRLGRALPIARRLDLLRRSDT